VSTDVLAEVDENIECGGGEKEEVFVRKGTFKVKRGEAAGKSGMEQKTSGCNKENGVSKETVKKLRDLNINIK
jgi:hypothetical protein